jgi:uncharacterized membrane protein
LKYNVDYEYEIVKLLHPKFLFYIRFILNRQLNYIYIYIYIYIKYMYPYVTVVFQLFVNNFQSMFTILKSK